MRRCHAWKIVDGTSKVQNVRIGGNVGGAKIRHMSEMLEISEKNIVKNMET